MPPIESKPPTREELLDEIESALSQLADGWPVHPPHMDHPAESLRLFRAIRTEQAIERMVIDVAKVMLSATEGPIAFAPAVESVFLKNLDAATINLLWHRTQGRFKTFHAALDHVAERLGLVRADCLEPMLAPKS